MTIFKGFLGGRHRNAALLQNNQESINYFPEIDPDPEAKEAVALLSAPGLVDQGQSTWTGQVRALHVLPSQNGIVAVIGSTVVLITLTPNGASRPGFAYSQIGTVYSTTGPVSIADNGQGHICVIVDGANMYSYNFMDGTFRVSVDPGFSGSYVVAEVDGWFVFCQPGSQKFYTSPLYWDGVSAFDATYFALKDDAHDNIVSMATYNRELWLIGSESMEVWYNAGNQYFPFSRLQGTMKQVGSAAQASLARYSGGLVWLGCSERGNNAVYALAGYEPVDIAGAQMAHEFNSYATVSDAIGYTYSEEGHEFYVLIFPTADKSWCYDFTTKQWHKRASFDPVAGQFHRQRANCVVVSNNMVIAGDYSAGNIYWQTRTAYADGAYPLISIRRAPHMWDKNNRSRGRIDRLQVEFMPGSAPASGTYANPQAILRWSDDGGQTWSNDHYAPIGATGQTKNRVIWRRLGISRDRVFEVRVSDPVNRDLTGASIIGSPFVF